VASVLCTSN